jgi:hypothetical protein
MTGTAGALATSHVAAAADDIAAPHKIKVKPMRLAIILDKSIFACGVKWENIGRCGATG